MDFLPIQRLATTASAATRLVEVRPAVRTIEPATQAAPGSADQTLARRKAGTELLVAWHAVSLCYVTSVVDRDTGDVLYQAPPEHILNMVQEVIERLEGEAT